MSATRMPYFVCLISLLVGHALADDAGKPMLEGSESVEGNKYSFKVSNLKQLLEDDERDLWIAVIPVLQPDTAYIQFGQVEDEGKRVAYLGVENKQVDEHFKIVLISVPKDAITKDGAMKISALKKLGYKRHATLEVHRKK